MGVDGLAYWTHHSTPWFRVMTAAQEGLYIALLLLPCGVLGPQRWHHMLAISSMTATTCLFVAAAAFALHAGTATLGAGLKSENLTEVHRSVI